MLCLPLLSRPWASSSLTAVCSGQLGLCQADVGSSPATMSTAISLALSPGDRGQSTLPAALPTSSFSEVKLAQSVQLFASPWTVTVQAHLPWDSPGKNTGVDSHCHLCRFIKPRSPALQEDSLLSEPPWKPLLAMPNFSEWKESRCDSKTTTPKSPGGLCSSAPWTVSLLCSAPINGKGRLHILPISIL